MTSTDRSRRTILAASGGATVAILANGCDILATKPENEGATKTPGPTASGGQVKEAPHLSRLVDDGKLEPLKRRIPANPQVVKPVDGLGRYGQDWRAGNIEALLGRFLQYEGLVQWKRNPKSFTAKDVLPNIAEKFEISSDTKTYRFVLRKGMRWSDGHPFSADDILFWYEHVYQNAKMLDLRPTWLSWGNPKVVREDQHTIALHLEQPDSLLLLYLAANASPLVDYPKHYMKQYHIDYNSKIEEQAKEADFDSWVAMFIAKADYMSNKDKPTMHPWVLENVPGESMNRVRAARNPYYWKTDPKGRQLPYLDGINFRVYSSSSSESAKLRALHGDVDIFWGPSWDGVPPRDKPVFARNRKDGNYHFQTIVPAFTQTALIQLNLTHQDRALREIFNSLDFRIGLSYAINRKEIINAVFQRQGEPYQVAPRPESPFFDKKLAKQYTRFSVGAANQHLDRVIPHTGSDGIRLLPDGNKVSFQVDVTTNHIEVESAMELVKKYWNAVGIDMNTNPVESTYFWSRRNANEVDAYARPGIEGLNVLLKDWRTPPMPEWEKWFNTGGKEGMEPPEPVKRMVELAVKVRSTGERQKQMATMRRVVRVHQEQFWTMGISLQTPAALPVKNDFHNVQDPILFAGSGSWPTPGPGDPEQFWKEPS